MLETLDAKDWQYVRDVWKIIGKYGSEIKAQEQRLSGVAPDMEEGLPVITKFGTYDGSYFPIKYDAEANPRVTSDISTDAANGAMAAMFTAPHTRDGFVKARVESTGKRLRLDEGVIVQHLNEVTHRLSHEDVFVDLGKILRDQSIQKTVVEKYGIHAYNIMRETIAAVANGDVGPTNGIEEGIRHLRVGLSTSVMGLNITSGLMQLPGITQSMVRVGPKWFGLAFSYIVRHRTIS